MKVKDLVKIMAGLLLAIGILGGVLFYIRSQEAPSFTLASTVITAKNVDKFMVQGTCTPSGQRLEFSGAFDLATICEGRRFSVPLNAKTLPDGPLKVKVRMVGFLSIGLDKPVEFVKDLSPPSKPGPISFDVQTGKLSWASSTGASTYEIALGKKAGDTDILPWRNIGGETSYPLDSTFLSEHPSIKASVKAVDEFGNESPIQSDYAAQPTPLPPRPLSSFRVIKDLCGGGMRSPPSSLTCKKKDLVISKERRLQSFSPRRFVDDEFLVLKSFDKKIWILLDAIRLGVDSFRYLGLQNCVSYVVLTQGLNESLFAFFHLTGDYQKLDLEDQDFPAQAFCNHFRSSPEFLPDDSQMENLTVSPSRNFLKTAATYNQVGKLGRLTPRLIIAESTPKGQKVALNRKEERIFTFSQIPNLEWMNPSTLRVSNTKDNSTIWCKNKSKWIPCAFEHGMGFSNVNLDSLIFLNYKKSLHPEKNYEFLDYELRLFGSPTQKPLNYSPEFSKDLGAQRFFKIEQIDDRAMATNIGTNRDEIKYLFSEQDGIFASTRSKLLFNSIRSRLAVYDSKKVVIYERNSAGQLEFQWDQKDLSLSDKMVANWQSSDLLWIGLPIHSKNKAKQSKNQQAQITNAAIKNPSFVACKKLGVWSKCK